MSWELLLFFLLSFFLVGCASQIPSPQTEREYRYYQEVLENATTPPKPSPQIKEDEIRPVFKEFSPLKRLINVAFYQEHYENIFYFLSIEAGLSVVIDPDLKREIPPEREKITLQMRNQPLEEVLKRVCEILDISYRIDKGVLYLQPFEEKVIKLGFLPVVKESRTTLGGDVLGGAGMGVGAGGGGGGSSPLRGEYSVNAELAKDTLDLYKSLEESIANLISEKGSYSLNRLTGILLVRDKPSKIRAIENLIDKFKEKYKRQVILDAKIVEIELNKAHDLGVDWFQITDYLLGTNRIALDTLSLDLTTRTDQSSFALTISGQPNINLLMNFLKQYGELRVISNPKIRVMHSQPALISVGTTYSYIKEFQRNVASGAGGGATETYTTTTSSIFEGILLGITPYIEDEEIFLHMVPIKSDLVDLKNVQFGGIYYINLPTVNLREMTSIIKVKPNDLVILGGLILEKDRGTERKLGIPILSEIGKRNIYEGKKSELVILIRVLVN